MSNLEEILASLYASEINASISWLWDGDIDEKLGDALNGYKVDLAEWQNYFLSFESIARTLGIAGIPHVAVRLREIEADVSGVLKTYQETCDSMVQHRQAILGINRAAAIEIQGIIHQVVDTHRRVFETFQTRWDNEFFNKCPNCHMFLESRTFPYCWNCHLLVEQF
jgi:hypothetical protein